MAHLSQLLALPHLGLKLLQSGAGDPEISWVSITELLDLSHYLEGGEVIMTTGLQLDGEAPRWNDFVASLSRARVAAIGFGIGVNHATVPAPLLRAASTYRVALFEIPLPTPFIAVSKAAAELLRADELRATRSALQVQLRLLDGTRGEQQPAEVLASIAQATGRQLALVTGTNTVIASTQGFELDALEPAATAEALVTPAHPATTVMRPADTEISGARADSANSATASTRLEYVPLDAEGTLKLAIAGTEPLTPEGSSVIAAGAMALGFGVRNDRTADRLERERWEFATEHVLNGTLPPEAVEVLSPGLALPTTVRAVAVQGAPEDVSNWRHEPRHGTELLITATEEIPGGLARAWQLVDGADPEPALARSAKYGLDLVVGRAVPPGAAALSARSAMARLKDLPGLAALYAEPRTPRAIWADRDAPFLEAVLALGAPGGGANPSTQAGGAAAIAAQVLGPLSDFAAGTDSTGNTGPAPDRALLRDTLMALFEADGQRGPAAAVLGIHRNTLRDRITRIERLTGRSIGSAADRAELWFALRTEALAG